MQREFTVSTGMKIIYCLLAAAIFSVVIYTLSLHKSQEASAAVYLIPVVFTVLPAAIVINTFKRKVIITENSITRINLFSITEIAIADVKGIRVGRKMLTIESNLPVITSIIIRNYEDLSDDDKLVDYLKGSFADLDAASLEDEKEKLLHDTNLGLTEDERQSKLANANKIAIAYTVLGVAMLVIAIFFDSINTTILLMIYPLLSIVIMAIGNGLIKFISDKKRSPYPFVIVGFFIPAMVSLAVAAKGSHIYSFDNLWLPVIILGAAVFVLIFRTGINPAMGNTAGQITIMAGMAMLYGFGTIMQINHTFDKSPDKIYDARVVGHHISRGRNTSYYLYLSTWGPRHEQDQVGVGRAFYNSTNIGDTVKIDLKPGFLHAPWYTVSK